MAIRIPVTSSGDEESSSREIQRSRQPEKHREREGGGFKNGKRCNTNTILKNWLRSAQGEKKEINRKPFPNKTLKHKKCCPLINDQATVRDPL